MKSDTVKKRTKSNDAESNGVLRKERKIRENESGGEEEEEDEAGIKRMNG